MVKSKDCWKKRSICDESIDDFLHVQSLRVNTTYSMRRSCARFKLAKNPSNPVGASHRRCGPGMRANFSTSLAKYHNDALCSGPSLDTVGNVGQRRTSENYPRRPFKYRRCSSTSWAYKPRITNGPGPIQ
ncbi:hypothetical protein TKK_0004782 [Trichogramma kaykai]